MENAYLDMTTQKHLNIKTIPTGCQTVDKFVCDACQRHVLDSHGYMLFPERHDEVAAWTEVCLDLIGHWTL